MWIECLAGDLHGDLAKARCALEMVGSLSSDGRDLWTGGETAKATGGAVFQVNENHETMNVEGDFRYVDSGAFDECLDFLEHLNDCEQNCPMPIFKLILEIEKVLFLPDN
ncbi:hypothetical protein U1Q18_026758 [Sarracenia purpurea var. burkii]